MNENGYYNAMISHCKGLVGSSNNNNKLTMVNEQKQSMA